MFPRFDFPSFRFVRLWPLEKQIREAEPAPAWYYGHAYSSITMCVEVFAVIPLNYLIRFRKWYRHRWDRFRCRPSWMDLEIRRQRQKAYQNGLRDGLDQKEEIYKLLTNLRLDMQAKKANPIAYVAEKTRD